MMIKTEDLNKYFNMMYNLKQRKSIIAQYVTEAKELYERCSSDLRTYLENQFIADLTNENKIDMMQVYLTDKTNITFSKAKKAVIKVYSRIERVSSFDILKETKSTSIDTQTKVNKKIMSFFKELRLQSQNFHARFSVDLFYSNTKSFFFEETKSYMSNREDFYCHNCTQSEHMFDSCSKSKVSYKQRMNN